MIENDASESAAAPMNDGVPSSLGYRMPAEWEPHEATWIAWPHNRDDWPGKFAPIPWVYTEIVRHLSRFEKVHIVVRHGLMRRRVTDQLKTAGVDLEAVRFFRAATDRVWLRDSGPTFVVKDDAGSPGEDRVGLIDWKFNAWAKYEDWKNDDRLPAYVAKKLRLRSWQPQVGVKRLVLEGGSVDVDGQGLLMTTEECLLSEVQQRNPGISREVLEQAFRDYLGIEQVLWLDRGIAGDDTHGHVDDLARFVRPGTIVLSAEADASDDNHVPLRDNLARLRAMRDLRGQPFEIVELPLPAPVHFNGQRLPASYANFYIANVGVLVPVFNDPNDTRALRALEELFRDRPVIPIYCRDLVWGLGALHCMTQQQPAPT
jgi:agmatine deiminase